ncbi:MAG: DUF3419 family protein [Clostridiales bacterium]|nr:DUF3419 family protein [Clostridiales bacterium]
MLKTDYINNPDIDLYEDSEYDYLTEKVLTKDIDEENCINCTVSACYITSNENLENYMYFMPLKDKRVATVGSSGDQALNAIYYGSKDVTLIDANPYSRAFTEYKIAMIKNFDCNKFHKILTSKKDLFSWITYRQISHDLSKDSQRFWDKLIIEQDNSPNSTLSSEDMYRILIQDYPFCSSEFYKFENYKKMQNVLKSGDYNLSFITAELSEFPMKLDGKYDSILLSNIYDYIYDSLDSEKFEKTIIKLYNDNLSEDGMIQVYYDMKRNGIWKRRNFYTNFDYNYYTVEGTFPPTRVWFINKTKDIDKIDNMQL